MSTGTGIGLTGPACGRCGYNTTGLTSLTCPECGSDLRAVGIVTAAASRRLTFPLAAAVFTLMWIFAGVLLPGVMGHIVPTPKRHSSEVVLEQPRSAAYAGVDVYGTGTSWGDERPPMSVVIALRPKPGSPPRGVGPMNVNPETGSYAYLDPTPKQVSAERGLQGEAVAQWLEAAGLDATDPRLQSEANRIAAAARHAGRRPVTSADLGGGAARRSVGNDPHFGSISYAAGYSPEPLAWLIIPLLALHVVAWWAGVRYLWRTIRDPAAHTSA